MRQTPQIFARFLRSRTIKPAAELASRDSSQRNNWCRRTAQVLEIALRNEAPFEWNAIKKYAELPPPKKDVEPLLTLLEARVLRKAQSNSSQGFEVIGDLAVQLGLTDKLSRTFIQQWLIKLQKTNPFKAIHIWKELSCTHDHDDNNKQLGVSLYLAAQQVDAAEKLASQLKYVPPALVRHFISKYIHLNRLNEAQKWIKKWQAPMPEDIRWLHHITRTNKVTLHLPEPTEMVYFPEATVKAGPKLQRLISQINVIITADKLLLENETIKEQWLAAMANPSQELVQTLCLSVAKNSNNESTDWVPILRLVDPNTIMKLLHTLQAKLTPRAFAVAITRTKTSEELKFALQCIAPELLYTRECLSALAQRQPTVLLELIVPPEFLEVCLEEHHLLALWAADPPPHIQEWLLPLTIKHCDSPRLLRSALASLMRQNLAESARILLNEFIVNRQLDLDPRVLDQRNNVKLSIPRKVEQWDKQLALKKVEDAVSQLLQGRS